MKKGWPSLVIPAIATERRRYPTGRGKSYSRPKDELIQPKRDRLSDYELLKAQHGSRVFAAQYQQDPTPPGGLLVKKEWLRRYDPAAAATRYDHIVIACDPAGKPGEQNDYTAIAVGGERQKTLCLLEVIRGHWTILQMERVIRELAARWAADLLIIEDTSSGTSLIQLLQANTRLYVRGERPKDDKETRMMRRLGAFEAGRILLPPEAPWLADFEKELLAFPSGRYDDQVDAVLLLLEWFAKLPDDPPIMAPIVVTVHRPFPDGL